MANEDILLTAALDPTAVENALKLIEARVNQMVQSSNARMQILGEATKQVAMLSRNLIKEFNAYSATNLTAEQKKGFEDLQKGILQTASSLDGLIDLMRSMEEIELGNTKFTAPRINVREIFESEIAKIDGEALGKKMDVIIANAEGRLQSRTKTLRDDLTKLLDDPTISAKELAKQIGIIRDELNSYIAAASNVPTDIFEGRVQTQDTRLRQLGELEGKDLQDRLYRYIKQTEGGITDMEKRVHESASNIRDDLVKALADPEQSGRALRAEIDRLEKEFEDVITQARAAQQTAASGAGLSLGGRQDTQAREVEATIAQAQVGNLQQRLEMLMQSSEETVRQGAVRIKAQLEGILDVKTEGSALEKELNGIRDQVKGLESVKQIDLVSEDEASQIRTMQLNLDKLDQTIEKGTGVITASAQANIEKERERAKAYADAAAAGRISYEQANTVIKQSTALVADHVKTYRDAKAGIDELTQEQARLFTEIEVGPLEQQILRLMQSSREEVVRTAATIQSRLNEAFALREGDDLLGFVRELQAEVNKLDNVKPLEVVSTEQAKRASDVAIALRQVDQTAAAVAQTVNAEGQEQIRVQLAAAQAARDNEAQTDAGQKRVLAVLTSVNTAIKKIGVTYREVTDDAENLAAAQVEAAQAANQFKVVDELVNAKKASNDYSSSMKDIEKLLKSDQAEVRQLATELKRIGTEAKEAFDKSESSAEDFEGTMNRVRSSVTNVANTYGEAIPSGANRANISLWKLGNVADRVGFRGAGGATQLIDALKGIPIAAVAAVVAVAAIGAAVVKVTQALVEMGKRAASAFLDFTKGAVETAKSVQVTDRQLGGFLRAPELGTAYRKLLQDLSFDVGLDLTKDFSRVLVPLARDLDEVEKAAEIAGTLAHAFQETDESIANAIKQASGGHFRPLIERFGLTEFEVSKIERYQEEFGEFTGVLKGLDEALQFRGLDLSTLSGTLQFIQGQMKVVRSIIETTFGEPVSEALGEQFKRIFDVVDDRKEDILGFFENLGRAVGGVVEAIGDVVNSFAEDVSDDDITDLNTAITDLGASIQEVVKAAGELFSTEDRSIVDVAVDLTNALTDVADQLREIVSFIDGLKQIQTTLNIDIPGTDAKLLDDLLKPSPVRFNNQYVAAFKTIFDTIKAIGGEPLPGIGEQTESYARAVPVLGTVVDLLERLGILNISNVDNIVRQTEAQDDNTTSVEENADALARLIDQHQRLSAQLADLEELSIKAADAQDKITEAEEKLARERSMREEEIRTRFDRQDIAAEVKRSEDREDLFKEHMRRMLQLTDQLNADIEKAGLDFDRKGEDAIRSYNDKLEDIARDTNEKKIDIEKKFQEKLKDIKAKFDLDAEEAIRKNDAVSLLRIRRRQALEVETARRNRDDQIKEAEDLDKQKRDNAKIWLDRQERDLDISEQRKLDDLEAADMERRQQLIDQYNWEYKQIDIEYERQRQARDVQLANAIEDMNKQFDVREAEMANSLEAEYNIVKEWKDKETTYMKLKLKEQANLVAQQYQLWAQEGSLFSQFMSGNPLSPNYGNPYSPFGGGQTTGLSGRTHGGSVKFGRAYGGYVSAGNVYGVNERGPEQFYATRAGVIAPTDSLLMSPYSGAGPTSIDNSRTVQAGDIYAMDPEKMSPIDRTLMAHRFTEQLLVYGL